MTHATEGGRIDFVFLDPFTLLLDLRLVKHGIKFALFLRKLI